MPASFDRRGRTARIMPYRAPRRGWRMAFRPSNRSSRLAFVLLPRVASFLWRVLTAFLRNRGILLAGGVGYNILLSIVPLFALLAVLLTQIVDERALFDVLSRAGAPPGTGARGFLLDAVRTLLDSPEVIGLFGTLVLLIFSSFALFACWRTPWRSSSMQPTFTGRSVWVSVLLPICSCCCSAPACWP
ncbi:hypothetical protein DSL92_08380 [Billgrantia gudaonensis]|uniref:YihY/virulence factor BrkB family protein n=1 Tax=Billgrantia gudaonensis TaxID=376427 RepID=A0A3S0NDK2_9GAMM|nr:hypothetical protein DSL92_08380 [Halomonas gudaonensis]